MVVFKVFVCVLLASAALGQEEDSGQYNPELYEKPYETAGESGEPAEPQEPAETPEPVEPVEPTEPVEPAEPAEPAEPEESPESPEVSEPAVVASADLPAQAPIASSVAAFPYPLLYSQQAIQPFLYTQGQPQLFRIPAPFPAIVY